MNQIKMIPNKKNILLIYLLIYPFLITNSQTRSDFSFDKKQKSLFEEESFNSWTIGYLNGGGSLIGIEHEEMVFAYDHYSLNYGIGCNGFDQKTLISSFNFGVNYHLKPTISSSMVSLNYWHQGFGDSFYQNIAGLTFILRLKVFFNFQIGMGIPLNRGPAFPENMIRTPIVVLYSIGVYFPH